MAGNSLKLPESLNGAVPHQGKHLDRRAVVETLRDVLSIAKVRRTQWKVKALPLYGSTFDENQSYDVLRMLRDGQLVALSATLVQEIINYLGDSKHFQELPTAATPLGMYAVPEGTHEHNQEQILRIRPQIGT